MKLSTPTSKMMTGNTEIEGSEPDAVAVLAVPSDLAMHGHWTREKLASDQLLGTFKNLLSYPLPQKGKVYT